MLSLPDVAERLGLSITRVHQMVCDGQLLALRRAGVVVPADFLSGREVVKGLPGTITLLRNDGYSPEEILRWLFTAVESLSGTPIDALRSEPQRTVKRRVNCASASSDGSRLVT